MGTALMAERTPLTLTWSLPRAGIIGGLYLVNIAGCMFAEVFVRGRLIVRGDAAATAGNILAHQSLFRSGVAAELVAVSCFVAAAVLLYDMFKPVSRSLSLLAAFFGLAEGAVHGVNLLNQLAPLVLLGGGPHSSAFMPEQLQALAYSSLRMRMTGFHVCMVFFGLYFLGIGYLAFVSTFLPRVLGAVLAIGGLSCLTGGFAALLSPAFAAPLYAYFLAPFGLARVFLAVWLLARGVNIPRWEARVEIGGHRTRLAAVGGRP